MSERPCDSAEHGCQIGDLFKMLGKAHMLDILHTLIQSDGPVRFNDVERRLKISPNTLSGRLKTLTEAGLITRTAYHEIPPRVDYQATDKALRLRQVFGALDAWAASNTLTAEITS